MATNSSTDGAVDRALDAVDFEIAQIRANQQTPGWTIWALLPSIGGLLWLLLAQLDTPVIPGSILRAYLAVSIVFDLVAGCIGIASMEARSESRLRPFRLGLDISGGRLAFGFWALLLGFRWWIVLTLLPDAPRTVLVPLFVFLGMWSFFAIVGVLLLILNVDLPFGGRPRGALWIGLALMGVLAWTAVTLTRFVTVERLTSTTEWKIAGILAAILFLMSVAARLVQQPPLLQALIALRRDLVFGRMGVKSALRQLEIVVAGTQRSDMLEREVERLLTPLREQGEELRAMVKESDVMRSAITLSGDEERVLTKDDVERWYKAHERSLSVRVDTVTKELERYYRRASWLVAGDREAKAAGKEIRTRISAEIDALKAQAATMRESVDALLKQTLEKNQLTLPP